MKRRNGKKHISKPPILKLVTASASGTLIGVVCFFALILLLGGICMLASDVHSLLLPASFAAIYLSSFAAGFSAVIFNGKEDRALSSLLGGVCLTILLTLILLPFSSTEGSVHFLLRFLGIPLALLGGYCVPRHSSRKKRRK